MEGKRDRRKALLDVLVRGNTNIPPSLVMFAVGLIRHWGDLPSCRRALAIANCMLSEYDSRSNVMKQRLSRDLFSGVVDSLVSGAPQLQGLEMEAINLAKTLYLSFGLGAPHNQRQRRQPGDDSLRKKLLSFPGVMDVDVSTMETTLRTAENDSRAKKEAMRDVLRRASLVAQNVAGKKGTKGGGSANFWSDNRGRSGGAKGQQTKNHANRNRNKKNGKGGGNGNDNDDDNPSSDILWQRR